jgi:3-keto-5-aminohexanoate cleavage enzyme
MQEGSRVPSSETAIIEVALNGVTSAAQNPHSPWEPADIARTAVACLDAGAAIVHNHVDRYAVSGTEAAERYLEAWRRIWERYPDALLYPTVNGGAAESSFSHLEPLARAGSRLGLIEAGSVNLGPMVYLNSAADIDHQVEVCHALGLGASVAVFEPGFLRAALRLHDDGRLPAGSIIKLFFCDEGGYVGGVFGLPPTRPSFDAYLSMLDGRDLPWMAAVLGGDILSTEIASLTLAAGGHLHVGIEDYCDVTSAGRTPSNEELVREAVEACSLAGRPLATSRDAAAIIGLPV